MAYRFDGKQKLLSFGQYPEVSPNDAREARQKARELLAKGGSNAGLLRLQFFDIGFNPRACVRRDGQQQEQRVAQHVSIHAPAWGATRGCA